VKPQLLSEIKTPVSKPLLDDNFSISQKIDGRRLILKTGLNIHGWARSGNPTNIPGNVMEAFSKVSPDWIFDGEMVKNTYHVFDLIQYSGTSISFKPWLERQNILNAVLKDFSPCVKIVPQFFGPEKLSHYEDCMEIGAEGVVFSHVESRYHFGLRSKRSLKYKFVKTIDCVVIGKSINDKDNLVLLLAAFFVSKEIGNPSYREYYEMYTDLKKDIRNRLDSESVIVDTEGVDSNGIVTVGKLSKVQDTNYITTRTQTKRRY
jgi:bifunctional non-homologous end joining protein LigD